MKNLEQIQILNPALASIIYNAETSCQDINSQTVKNDSVKDATKWYRVLFQTWIPRKGYKFSRKDIASKMSPDGKIIKLPIGGHRM